MLTEKEVLILKLLRENSRTTVTELARKVNLPRSTVYEKIKKFRQEGIVNKYSCLVNFANLGFPIAATVLFKVNSDKTKFGEDLANSANTNNVVRLGNEYDYLASFIFDSMDNLHKFLENVSENYGIQDYRILYVAKDLKKEGFLL
jgi:Lrp/AsnC family transcriptional regulator for asnA, asnC and gidA